VPRISTQVILKGARAKGKRLGRVRNPATLAENVTRDVKQIISEDVVFRLRQPIDLTVRHSGPHCFIGYAPLDISGYGRNEEEALRSFADVFAITWNGYARAKDSQLTSDAQDLKQKLLNLVAFAQPTT